jgi:hypothetical protein
MREPAIPACSADANRDQRLSEQEFVGEKRGEARDKARRRFRSLDANGNKSLSLRSSTAGRGAFHPIDYCLLPVE